MNITYSLQYDKYICQNDVFKLQSIDVTNDVFKLQSIDVTNDVIEM
ncbi:TPA: hypothetical protein I1510_001320 [Staphylococcus pseudintermedius]|nr:hypothetical protein [Staphylococcus pseudintermedius]HAR5785182.1 hypothetical protein [Staphylococcus pseudintermedius]HCG2249255.1 hypothetical protein [Staphylococcus pseudintermedius]